MKPSKLIPALAGGAAMAILQNIPIVSCGCCLWIIGGGILAGYLYSRNLPPDVEFSTGDGVVTGLLAGLFGALFSTFLMVIIQLINPEEMNIITQILDSGQDIPYEMEEFLESLEEGGGFITAIFMFVVFAIVDGIFSMLGGLLSAQLFKNKKPPQQNQPTVL